MANDIGLPPNRIHNLSVERDELTACVGCDEVECECAAREIAWRLLATWLGAPGTRRRVTNVARAGLPTPEAPRGAWVVALSAGGYVVESDTQRTLAGAIRNALQAAVLLVLCLVLGLSTGACGGQVEGSTEQPANKALDTCWYLIDGCKYSTPIQGAGTRELSCPLKLDYSRVIDVVCGAAALPSCHSEATCQ